MLEQIVANQVLYALILRKDFHADGIRFFTPPEMSQQLGYMSRPKGYLIPAHFHQIQFREISLTQEVLFIKSGLIQVDFFDNNHQKIKEELLHEGDVLMLIQGGHGFSMLEDSEIVEVKQGPYLGDRDKKYI